MFYAILEKTPCPGYFAPMAVCHIQSAEHDIGGIDHYHQGAARLGSCARPLYLYPLEKAKAIVEHSEKVRPWSEHMLIAFHAPIEPFAWA